MSNDVAGLMGGPTGALNSTTVQYLANSWGLNHRLKYAWSDIVDFCILC